MFCMLAISQTSRTKLLEIGTGSCKTILSPRCSLRAAWSVMQSGRAAAFEHVFGDYSIFRRNAFDSCVSHMIQLSSH